MPNALYRYAFSIDFLGTTVPKVLIMVFKKKENKGGTPVRVDWRDAEEAIKIRYLGLTFPVAPGDAGSNLP